MTLMADSLNRRRWSGWCLVTGPVDFVEPEFSFDMQGPIAEYRASLVAVAALSIPGVRLTHSALPSWWDWRASWTGDGGSYIDLAMTLFDDDVDPPIFGGFNVTATVHDPRCSPCGWRSGASSRRSGYTRPIAASTSTEFA
jgi:hypothetical protein